MPRSDILISSAAIRASAAADSLFYRDIDGLRMIIFRMSDEAFASVLISIQDFSGKHIHDPCIGEYGTTWNLSGRCFQQVFGMFCQQFQHVSSS